MTRTGAMTPAERATFAHIHKRYPNALEAWRRDVNIPVDEFQFGTMGRPPRWVAIDRQCWEPSYTDCRCRQYIEGAWQPRPPCRTVAPSERRAPPLPELVHRPEFGRRDPLEVGCWAVYEDKPAMRDHNRIALPLQLVRIVAGPFYEADASGSAVSEWWETDVANAKFQRWSLTRLWPDVVLAEARGTIRAVLAFDATPGIDSVAVRVFRAAELARLYLARLGSAFEVGTTEARDMLLAALEAADAPRALLEVEAELSAALERRRWMLHVAVPSFVANLYTACALTLAASGARFETWPPWEKA